MIELSIVIPTYKSAEFIELTLTNIYNEVSKQINEFEIIVINDGSDINITSKVLDFKNKNEKIKLLNLDKNYGQQVATHTGIMFSKGLYIITFDDDLQFNPADILLMYNSLKNNQQYDICCGYPIKKIKKGKLYPIIYALVDFLIYQIFFPVNRNRYFFTSFKIYKRSLFFDKNKFLNKNIYYFWEFNSKRIYQIYVTHHSRISGNSGYGFIPLIKFAKHIILKVLTKIIWFFSFIFGIFYLYDAISTKTFFILLILTLSMQLFLNYWLKKIRNLSFKTNAVKCL